MKANCVVCGAEFEKRRCTKTCSAECSSALSFRTRQQKERRYKSNDLAKYLESARDRTKKYRTVHREKISSDKKANRSVHRKANAIQMRKWREKNAEHYKQWRDKYVTNNREKIRSRMRDYMRVRSASLRAAKRLGIPPLLYAAMKFMDRFNHLEEQSA